MKKILTILVGILIISLLPGCPGVQPQQNIQKGTKPAWAANMVGDINIYTIDLPSKIEYGKSIEFTLDYRSTIYTGEDRKYQVTGIIYTNVGRLDKSTFSYTVGEGFYSNGKMQPDTSSIDTFTIDLPENIQPSDLSISVYYNITGLKTKIMIPLDLKSPPAGSGEQTISVPVYYTASPIVPSSSVNVELSPKSVRFSLDISDVSGCFSALTYDRDKYVIARYVLKSGVGGEDLSNIMTCSGIRSDGKLYVPGTIYCTIRLDKNNEILDRYKKEGVYLEFELELSYNCYKLYRTSTSFIYQ